MADSSLSQTSPRSWAGQALEAHDRRLADRPEQRRSRLVPSMPPTVAEPGRGSEVDFPPMSESTRIIPLGGLGEVGKNMTVDRVRRGHRRRRRRPLLPPGRAPRRRPRAPGLRVPPRAPGEIRAVVLTHGHEDHVGALPYLLREVEVPEVWATRLTLGLVKSKLDEHGLLRAAELVEIEPEKGRDAARARTRRSSCAWPTRSRTRSRWRWRRRAGWSSSPATTRSTTRRWTGSAPISASSPSSGTAASTCSSATRRTRSGRA